jgi:hypothetical protein
MTQSLKLTIKCDALRPVRPAYRWDACFVPNAKSRGTNAD